MRFADGTLADEHPRLVVVLHDVAPTTWAGCQRVLRCVQSVAPLPLTWLVVPRYHGTPRDPGFEDALDGLLARGDELALHGYTHRDDGRARGLDRLRRHWYTAGEGEFAALSQTEARSRLLLGMDWFERRGWPLHGFVAPAWLSSPGTWAALDELGFAYGCTVSRIVALPSRHSLRSQSLVYSTRSAWRRVASRAWNAAVARAERAGPLLRFELHPWDADHPPIRRSWMRLLERAVREREPLTLAQVARQLDVAPAG